MAHTLLVRILRGFTRLLAAACFFCLTVGVPGCFNADPFPGGCGGGGGYTVPPYVIPVPEDFKTSATLPPHIQGNAASISVDGDGNQYAALISSSLEVARFNVDGSTAWHNSTAGGAFDYNNAGLVVAGGVVYACGTEITVIALDAATGAPVSGWGNDGILTFSGSKYDNARGLAVAGNSLYLVGTLNSTDAGFGGTGAYSGANGSAFVLAVDATTGAPLSDFGTAGMQTFGGTISDTGEGSARAVAVSGGVVYVAGIFRSDNAGVGGLGSFATTGGTDVFVMALDAATGKPLDTFGTGGVQTFGGAQEDTANAIVVAAGTVYVGGSFTSLDAGVGGAGTIVAAGGNSAFIIALDAGTGQPVTAFSGDGVEIFGGPGGNAGIESIAVAGTTVFAAGSFDGTNMGIGGSGTIASPGPSTYPNSDGFILALDSASGAAITAFSDDGIQTIAGSAAEYCTGVAAANGRLYATGTTTSMDFGIGEKLNVPFISPPYNTYGYLLWMDAATGAAPPFLSRLAVNGTVGTAFTSKLPAGGTPPLTFAVTTLPPGLRLAGDTISGTPTSAGYFKATVSASNSLGTAEATAWIAIAGSMTTADTDGDGFPDEIETALGTSPTDAADTPLGGLPAGDLQAVALPKLSLSLRRKSGTDQIGVSGALHVPAGFKPEGEQVTVDIGGVVKSFTLDAHGSSPPGQNDSFKIRLKTAKGAVVEQDAAFTLKLSNGTFHDPLSDEIGTKTFSAVLYFNKTLYSANQGKLSVHVPRIFLFSPSPAFDASSAQSYGYYFGSSTGGN